MLRVLLLLALPCLALAAGPPHDIACEAKDEYIGGIDRIYALKIGDAKDRKWEYSFKLAPGADLEGKINASGTYEQADGLAIFTGKVNGEDIRFGLNYGFPCGDLQFNGFFPDEENKSLRYRRQWFHKVGADWKPLAAITLSMPKTLPPLDAAVGSRWAVPFKGEFTEWAADGAAKRAAIDETLTYTLGEGGIYQLGRGAGRTRPANLVPIRRANQLMAAVFVLRQASPSGFLRGFRPQLATED